MAARIRAKRHLIELQQSVHQNQTSEMDREMNITLPRLASIAALTCMSMTSAYTAASAQQVLPEAKPSVTPTTDSFYKSPTAAQLASARPGDVLRYRRAIK